MRILSRSAISLAAALVTGLLAVSSSASVVVLNHASPNASSMYYADAGYAYTTAAAGFQTSTTLAFNSLNWWGGYEGRTTQTSSIDNFTLTLYAAKGSVPGALLKTISLGSAQRITGTRLMYGSVLEYAYSAHFDDIELLAGGYFVGLTNADSDINSSWGWETSSMVGQGGASRASSGSWLDTQASLAFQLVQDATVPEPSSLALVGAAFAGLALFGRRTAKAA